MRFVLMCQVLDGDSPIQVKWFKDQKEILPNSESSSSVALLGGDSNDQNQQQNLGAAAMDPASSTLGIELLPSEELGASLVFRHVHAKHAGNYTCLASNSYGSSAFSSIMSVKGECKHTGHIQRITIIRY